MLPDCRAATNRDSLASGWLAAVLAVQVKAGTPDYSGRSAPADSAHGFRLAKTRLCLVWSALVNSRAISRGYMGRHNSLFSGALRPFHSHLVVTKCVASTNMKVAGFAKNAVPRVHQCKKLNRSRD
jgi:hypothetical protein